MTDFLRHSVFFSLVLTLASYGLGVLLHKRWKTPLLNPLIVSIALIIGALLLTKVDYETYSRNMEPLSFLLTPATVCYAIPLYEQLSVLRKNGKAILLGILCGVLASLSSILFFSWLFRLDHTAYVTLLPKSITMAIAMGLVQELGGFFPLTMVAIAITGNLGNMAAELVCRVFHITDPVAKGVAIGTSSHAMGTAKAMEMGEVEGAMSALSIVVAGLFTVVGAAVFSHFL